MVTATLRKQQFQERLERISSGGPNTLGQLYAGPANDTMRKQKASSRKGARKPEGKVPSGGLISGFMVGVLAVVLVRYARFQLTGTALGGANADLLLIIDVVLGITMALMLRSVVPLQSRTHVLGKVIGVAAMALWMHNLVFLAPDPFAWAFSPEWVGEVLTTTPEGRLLTTAAAPSVPAQTP